MPLAVSGFIRMAASRVGLSGSALYVCVWMRMLGCCCPTEPLRPLGASPPATRRLGGEHRSLSSDCAQVARAVLQEACRGFTDPKEPKHERPNGAPKHERTERNPASKGGIRGLSEGYQRAIRGVNRRSQESYTVGGPVFQRLSGNPQPGLPPKPNASPGCLADAYRMPQRSLNSGCAQVARAVLQEACRGFTDPKEPKHGAPEPEFRLRSSCARGLTGGLQGLY